VKLIKTCPGTAEGGPHCQDGYTDILKI